MIKKHQIGLFLDTAGSKASSPTWARVKKSTELTLAMNPETEDFDYISDESPTTELSKYAPKIEQPLKMIKGEPDFEYIWDIFYNMKVGEDAKTKALIVFMFDSTGSGDSIVYKAWEVNALVSCNELNAVDSEIKFDLAFGGTVKKGTVSVTGTAPDYVPVFTETTP